MEGDSKNTNYHPNLQPEFFAIQLMGLNFDYGGPSILRDLTLDIPRGSRCLLIGTNGAGKSTLLSILAGKRLVKEHAYVLGKQAFSDRPSGVVFLGSKWAANPATKSDIQVSHLIKSVCGDQFAERRDELLRILDVDSNWHMHQISEGERRRVQLVLGLMQPWEVLLLDEVTVNLDVLVRVSLFKFLKRETDSRGATVLYATHIFDGLSDWATRLAHIQLGTVKKVFPIYPPLSESISLRERLVDFPEFLRIIENIQEQVAQGEITDPPIFNLIQKWLQKDFLARIQSGNCRAHRGPGEGASAASTLWDDLSNDIYKYGDKYFNYWK